MKRVKFLSTYLATFSLGGFAGWLAFHEPETLLQVTRSARALSVFTYYVNRQGAQVQHGWAYTYHFADGTSYETKQRFARGKLVSNSDGLRYSSAEANGSKPSL